MIQFSLQQGHSITTALWVTAIAVALAALFYWRAFRTLKPRQRQMLLALRTLAILTIIVLLFRPVLSFRKEVSQKKSVIFLIDTSSSMGISDDASGVTRFEQARDKVNAWSEQLQGGFQLQAIEFSERARSLADIKQLPTLTAQGKATSLSRALAAGAQAAPRRDIEAIFLVSDGIHNSARDPKEIARTIGVVVHAVGVGASLRSDATYRDIQVASMNCPDTMMLNNLTRITAGIEAVGLAGRVVRAILEEDGKPIGEQELALDEVEGAQEVKFEFRPTVLGRHEYAVRIPPVPEEKIEENNQRSAVALVVEPGIRVLYLEGTLRPEYGAIVQRFLSKDPDLQFCALVQTRPNEFLRRTNIDGLELESLPATQEEVAAFDVFILGDLDSSYIKPPQQELIAQRVRDGAGLVMLGGYRSLGPGGYQGTPIGEILPVLLGDRNVGQVDEPFLPVLTPDGSHHPIFANIAGFFPTASGDASHAGLPELDGCTRVAGARPGATVLAACPLETGAQGLMPVLAIQPVDKGRAAVFCADTTRKWQQGPRALGQESPFLQFWGQLVRWAAGRSAEVETEASITSSTDKGYYEPEEEMLISAIVRNEKGEGSPDAKVLARVRGPEGRTTPVEMPIVAGAAGHYQGRYTPAGAGSYEIAVEAKLGAISLEGEKLAVEVGRPYLEFEKLDLDEKRLAEIAADTGGRYMHISTADSLIDQLDRTERKRQVQFETPLAVPLPLWLLFVGAVTTEWVLRRRFQLR
ncbi:MAG: glutamine amidotransferase [Thermoguttaceae bacterium]